MLRDRYGVPVGGMESVPQWLTANARPGGPPPDSESLNLDLARLNLSCRGTESEPPDYPTSAQARTRKGPGT
jgi:hypothetical protein